MSSCKRALFTKIFMNLEKNYLLLEISSWFKDSTYGGYGIT